MEIKKLTKEEGVELGFHPYSVQRLIKNGAVVIDGVVFAPVKPRPPKSKK